MLVTGGSSGIGAELVSLLRKRGFAVCAPGRDIADLSNTEGLTNLKEIFIQERVDLLINNAGMGFYGSATQLPVHKQEEMFAVNLRAPYEMTLHAVKTWEGEKRQGIVMNIASVAAFLPAPLMALYGATKAFMVEFSRSIDGEVKSAGSRVLVSCPGQVQTSFASKAARRICAASLFSMSARRVALEILWQIDQQKGMHIFDARYRLLLLLARLLPDSVTQKIIAKSILNRL